MRKFFNIVLITLLLVSGACEKPHIPLCRLAITPSEGTLHTYFLMSAESCSDSGNPNYSLKFRWDTDGDGKWETDFSTDRELAWRYYKTGFYSVMMEVVDPDGYSVQLESVVEVTNMNQAPVPYLKLSLSKASLTTPIVLDGSFSFDYEEYYSFLRYRWDYDSDGIWETGFSSSSVVEHFFVSPGVYKITMEVMDSDSASAKTTKLLSIINTRNLYSCLVDIRNNMEYPTVLIGNRWWMAANLDYGEVKIGNSLCSNNSVPEMYVYRDVYSNHNLYGGLYTWEEAVSYDFSERAPGICPAGWHIPDDSEWMELESELGISPDQLNSYAMNRGEPVGGLLKVDGSSGFEAGLFGFWSPSASFFGLGSDARFWSSSDSASGAWCRILKSGSMGVQRLIQPKTTAIAIRCIKDE